MRPLFEMSRLAGAALLLAGTWGLPATPARAQAPATTGRWHLTPGALVYLDGQLTTASAIEHLDDESIACVEGLTGRPGVAHYFGDSTATRVLVVTTKANANAPATLALADRTHLSSAYTTRAATLREVAPSALAYITSHFPRHWLGGEVLELTRKSTGAVSYRVQLVGNWGFRYVSFTAAGEFVSDQLW